MLTLSALLMLMKEPVVKAFDVCHISRIFQNPGKYENRTFAARTGWEQVN